MKVVGLLAFVILYASFQTISAQDPWTAAAAIVIQRIGTLFDEGSFELFDHSCQYKVKPSVRRFKLTYQGKVWCPGWTSIDGGSSTKSKNGAIEHAIRDFVNKVRTSGLVSETDAQAFLQRYEG